MSRIDAEDSSEVAFTPVVKAIQAKRGSRRHYEKLSERGGFHTGLTPDLAAFIAQIDTAFLATANASGQPYAQHRGGPKGFIRVIDADTLGFADFRGNRQYITTGNLVENEKAFLFLMDYANRRRVKLWGRAKVSEEAEIIAKLAVPGYPGKPEQAILFSIEAWDINCPQHIPQKLDAAMVADALAALQTRVQALETENAALRRAADEQAKS
jgi:predicted pyridoxine 5'-phosphate oxidase superfamily flavin-nucleotide-binding protein